MYKEIYEAKPFYGVNPAFVIFCVITVLITLLVIVFWKKVDTGVRCLVSAIIVFMFFIISCQAYTSIDAKRKVYNAYVAGEYLEIQGVISDPGFVSAWGYPLKQVDGGILQEGITVRICYIPYKYENVIMKLEVIE